MRQTFKLTDREWKNFRRLHLQPFQNVALDFWARAALQRGCDPKTVISNGSTFSALPEGHGKHWCYPSPLRCRRKPVYREI